MRTPQEMSYHDYMNSWLHTHVSSYDTEMMAIQKYINQMKADIQSMVDRTVWYGDDTFPDEILRRRNRTW